MANCELSASCFFLNVLVSDKSQTMIYLKDKYCNGESAKCGSGFTGRMAGAAFIYPSDFIDIPNTH